MDLDWEADPLDLSSAPFPPVVYQVNNGNFEFFYYPQPEWKTFPLDAAVSDYDFRLVFTDGSGATVDTGIIPAGFAMSQVAIDFIASQASTNAQDVFHFNASTGVGRLELPNLVGETLTNDLITRIEAALATVSPPLVVRNLRRVGVTLTSGFGGGGFSDPRFSAYLGELNINTTPQITLILK